MTKQEKIKEAYGDYYGECNPFIDTDGWFDKNAFYNNSLSIRYSNINELFVHKGDFMRPKKLQGIEDNNGWIIGFPEKDGNLYWVLIESLEGKVLVHSVSNYDEFHGDIDRDSYCFKQHQITHYQKIKEPENPIYLT